MCNLKSCAGLNFPLLLQFNEVAEESTEYNQVLTQKMLRKIDWRAFHQVAEGLGHTLPEELSEEDQTNEALMQRIHHLLFNVIIVSGGLTCQKCGRVYPIDKGIPNMLLEETEEQ
jgi:multifunctional methyltransferase subunit TRM112